MGVDLRLHPLYIDRPECSPSVTWVALELDRDRGLWERIEQSGVERPLGQAVYRSDEGPPETETPYGTPLTFAFAGDLASLLAEWIAEHAADPWPTGVHTRAAAAYLRELPAARRVVLWWH